MSSSSSEKCITESKTKQSVSDVATQENDKERVEFNSDSGKKDESSFDESNTHISDIVSRYIPIEQDILNINEENIDEIYKKIKESFTTFDFVTGFIEYALNIRPKQKEILISLLSKLSKVSTYTPHHLLREHKINLIEKGIIKGKIYRSKRKKFFEEGSIEEAIKEDSIDKLIKISAEIGFNPKRTHTINIEQSLYLVVEDIDKHIWKQNDIEVTYMQLMAYFGSIKCFKYAMIDGSFDDNNVSEFAVAGGNFEIIRLLEQKGVSFDDCFDVSIKFHRYEISEWLFKNYQCKISINKICEYYNDRMFLFCIQNKIDFTQDSVTVSKALTSSAKKGRIEFVKYFFENCNANVETKDYKGLNPLNNASINGFFDIVKYLVENCHAKVDEEDFSGNDPLNNASRNGNKEIVKYFVENCHSDVETKSINGFTPLNNASYYGYIDIVKYLVENCHAEVETMDVSESTPLNWASENGYIEVVKYLVENCHAEVETEDFRGNTPLNKASVSGCIDVVKYLVENCHADVETKECDGKTPLSNASIFGYIKVVKYLVENCHADVETKDCYGKTPLNIASENGYIDLVKYLVENCHADVETKDCDGRTPLNNASLNDRKEVVKYLIKYCGAKDETK